MKIVVGLGNPGEKYLKTRHNCGFIVVDQLLKEIEDKSETKIDWKQDKKSNSITAKVTIQDQAVLLVKPQTMMNLSGIAVSKILNFYKEPIRNLVVIYDDIDLALGTTRTRKSGSAGTHNGMRSIIQELGTKDFSRIRIGIESRGDLTPEQQDLSSYVLSNFGKKELPALKKAIEEAIEELTKIIL